MSAVPMEDLPRRHRITVQDYYRMAEVGLLAPDARVELIDGEILDMAPIGPPHGGTVMMLDQMLQRVVGDRAMILCQGSIVLGKYSQPQPDLGILRPRADYYRTGHASAAETLLLIEVSDTTWRYDRYKKVPFYAREGIPELWIVDLPRSTLHFFRGLSGGRYTDESSTKSPGVVSLPGLPGASIELSALFEVSSDS
ncbi:MAG TPA: Uma2 family endonuclease [Steroidobacteraceae bacterium]|nr:Uma2 family endonuclease [Steroidobacteraceae bacterium]